MSIFICRLKGEQGTATLADIRHGAHEFTALIHGQKSELQALVNTDCVVEISVDRVEAWRELPSFSDEQSCIMSNIAVPDCITVRGRVHNVVVLEDKSKLIDLYLRNGPEFFTISSRDLEGEIPGENAGIEVSVSGLCFYPTNT